MQKQSQHHRWEYNNKLKSTYLQFLVSQTAPKLHQDHTQNTHQMVRVAEKTSPSPARKAKANKET